MTSGRTSNFGFPLFEANDVTSWLVDFNGAMTDIDTAAQGIKTTAVNAGEAAAAAQGSVSQINQQLVNINNQLAAIAAWQAGVWGGSIAPPVDASLSGQFELCYSENLGLLSIHGEIQAQNEFESGKTILTQNLILPKQIRYLINAAFVFTGTDISILNLGIKPTGEIFVPNAIPSNSRVRVQGIFRTNTW